MHAICGCRSRHHDIVIRPTLTLARLRTCSRPRPAIRLCARAFRRHAIDLAEGVQKGDAETQDIWSCLEHTNPDPRRPTNEQYLRHSHNTFPVRGVSRFSGDVLLSQTCAPAVYGCACYSGKAQWLTRSLGSILSPLAALALRRPLTFGSCVLSQRTFLARDRATVC